MFTVMWGLCFTLKPYLPWKSLQGWASFFFIHFHLSFHRRHVYQPLPKLKLPEKKFIAPRVVDPTKRRSLQPGSMQQLSDKPRVDAPVTAPISDVSFSNKQRVSAPLIVDDPQMGKFVKVQKLDPTPFETRDETKKKHRQPTDKDLDTERKKYELQNQSFSHKFFGSQLSVGEIVLVKGLSVGLHTLEITSSNQLFIDNNPYPANPDDLIKAKIELLKLRK